jgi:hypothetical protein
MESPVEPAKRAVPLNGVNVAGWALQLKARAPPLIAPVLSPEYIGLRFKSNNIDNAHLQA